ncbi:MAG TPA: TIM barrel protein [Flavitalea sp.]|nr:TIM barrel protein [Flavitalea sp.]
MKNAINIAALRRPLFFLVACLLWISAGTARAQQKKTSNDQLYFKKNLVAWCVIPFDSKKRSPEERAIMLKSLGFRSFAYDWRANDLPSMETELATLKKYNIALSAVWFHIDGNSENLLDETNETILNILQKTNTHTELWINFNPRYFKGSQEEKLQKAISMVRYIHERAAAIGCTIALYAHGGWFGEPGNQVAIIRGAGLPDTRVVYNFHHGHKDMDNFAEVLSLLGPYLSTVNLNGMRAEGPQILGFGEGDREAGMLKTLKASGYSGLIGIIGHTENEDVQLALQRNLDGLKKVLLQIGEKKAAKTYK